MELYEIDILNELYVGETKFINELINAISEARAPYVGKVRKPITGNKDFIKIGDMIAKEFGFYSVTFMVPYDLSMNAFTYPITMAIDETIINKKPKFFKDSGLKYDENTGKMCIIVAITAGTWFSEEITDREVVALLLHEIGHSFVIQSERLIDIIETNRISIAFLTFYKIFMDLINPFSWGSIPNDIKTIMYSSNKGKEIINTVSKQLANNPYFIGFKGVVHISKWINAIIYRILNEISSLFLDLTKVISIPVSLLNRIFSIFNKQDIAIARSQEYLSDSFASMYGLGPELSSALTKIGLSSKAIGSTVDYIISSIPIIGALHESLNIPILYLSYTINTHPSTPARVNKILNELNQELKNSDLDPKTKKQLQKNIKDLEAIKDEYTKPIDNKKYDAEMIKKMWLSFITNKGEIDSDYVNYYTDLKERDKYVKEQEELDRELLYEMILYEYFY